jgi:SNF2 family DNA or RNA helicase
MGTGKTLAALWAADAIMREEPGTKCLIVAPLSTLKRVWQDEIYRNFLGKRRVAICHGTAEQRCRALAQDADFYIVNTDGLGVGASITRRGLELKGFAQQLHERRDIRIVIADEASAYKDPGSKRHRVARALIGDRPYLWLLTGTPTPNAPTDAYGLAKLVNNAYGESFTSFKSRTMMQVSQWSWKPRVGSHELVKQLLSPSVRFSIDDCTDLPELIVSTREAELSTEQKQKFKELKRDCVVELKGQQVTAVNEAVLRLKLIQIVCGAVYDAQHEAHTLDASPRLKVLDEVIEECNEKVIVFAPLTSIINLIYLHLKDKHSTARIDGSVTASARAEIFDAFQSRESPRIIVADARTMAHGLTLTAATTVVWYGPTDSTEQFLQANKRIHRPGQSRSCRIVQIVSTDIEREIFKRLRTNESLQGLMLQLAEEK